MSDINDIKSKLDRLELSVQKYIQHRNYSREIIIHQEPIQINDFQSHEDNLRNKHSVMINAGFTPDFQNKLYVKEGLGAFKTNINNNINSIEELKSYVDPVLNTNSYSKLLHEMEVEGGEYTIGPGAPADNGVVYCNGVYCTNYLDVCKNVPVASDWSGIIESIQSLEGTIQSSFDGNEPTVEDDISEMEIELAPNDKENKHERMINAGFSYDEENNVYVKDELGVFKSNIDSSIQSLDDLKSFFDPILNANPYNGLIQELEAEGGEYIIGPGAPGLDGNIYCNGIYCTNYYELINGSSRK